MHTANNNLYLRVSVTNQCNCKCTFCSNEGNDKSACMLLDETIIKKIISASPRYGYNRIQFTGGEPLLCEKLGDFIFFSKNYFKHVGVTTNGTFLEKYIDLFKATNLSALHISITEEKYYMDRNQINAYLFWLIEIINNLQQAGIAVNINMPYSININLEEYFFVLKNISARQLNTRVFYVRNKSHEDKNKNSLFLSMVEKFINQESTVDLSNVQVRRDYIPSGLRCLTCDSKNSCYDRSKSLRVSPNGVLRPCLNSRMWDIKPSIASLEKDLAIATLLAEDY